MQACECGAVIVDCVFIVLIAPQIRKNNCIVNLQTWWFLCVMCSCYYHTFPGPSKCVAKKRTSDNRYALACTFHSANTNYLITFYAQNGKHIVVLYMNTMFFTLQLYCHKQLRCTAAASAAHRHRCRARNACALFIEYISSVNTGKVFPRNENELCAPFVRCCCCRCTRKWWWFCLLAAMETRHRKTIENYTQSTLAGTPCANTHKYLWFMGRVINCSRLCVVYVVCGRGQNSNARICGVTVSWFQD